MGGCGALFIEFINACLGTRAMPVCSGTRRRKGVRVGGGVSPVRKQSFAAVKLREWCHVGTVICTVIFQHNGAP